VDVEVSPTFVGVTSNELRPPSASTNTITWVGDPDDGSVEVIWAATPPVDLRDGDGRPVQPRFIGRMSSDQLATVREALSPPTSARSWSGGLVVCSLVVANPYWNSSVNQARGGVSQVCSNHTTQKVDSRLYEAPWVPWRLHELEGRLEPWGRPRGGIRLS
jgi:hypothetical protein